jgi:hypothetical protein
MYYFSYIVILAEEQPMSARLLLRRGFLGFALVAFSQGTNAQVLFAQPETPPQSLQVNQGSANPPVLVAQLDAPLQSPQAQSKQLTPHADPLPQINLQGLLDIFQGIVDILLGNVSAGRALILEGAHLLVSDH